MSLQNSLKDILTKILIQTETMSIDDLQEIFELLLGRMRAIHFYIEKKKNQFENENKRSFFSNIRSEEKERKDIPKFIYS